MDEAVRRHEEMLKEWEAMGHRRTACSGQGHPLPDCPAPEVHEQVFQEAEQLTFGKTLSALRAVYEDIDSTGRAGDEWAYEWIHEMWTRLVPAVVRRAVEGPGGGPVNEGIVPKVTASTETAVLWFVRQGDISRARELIGVMGPDERDGYRERLLRILNWVESESRG